MRQKIICTQGIPASGKSTWAKKFVSENSGWVRINKDDIRKGMRVDYWPDGGKFDKKLEDTVIAAEREAVIAMVKAGYNVVVDNTHLLLIKTNKNKHLDFYRKLAVSNNCEFEIKTFHIDTDVAIERDSKREGSECVWPEVFARMKKYSKFPWRFPDNPTFKEFDVTKNPCILVDLDGTLSFMDGKRSPFDGRKVGGDRLNEYLNDLLRVIECTPIEIIFLSGRSEDCRKETESWLKKYQWDTKKLFMRESGDNRKDTIVKKELYEKYIAPNYSVFAIFDDRNSVVDMWREIGLPTYQVWYGDF